MRWRGSRAGACGWRGSRPAPDPRGVEVRALVLVTGDVAPVRRALARHGRPGSERRRGHVAEQRADAGKRARGDGLRAAARLEARVLTVAVEVLRLAGQPHEGLEEL